MSKSKTVMFLFYSQTAVRVLYSFINLVLENNDLDIFFFLYSLLASSRIYWDCSLRDLCGGKENVMRKIYRKARRLYISIHGKEAPKPFGV